MRQCVSAQGAEFYLHCADDSEAYYSVQRFLMTDAEQHAYSQRVAVVGPVYAWFDQ